ncbi:hypothetical protein ACQEVB_11680 [Pseudonocardia sp. CA-107938]|uniref:hypothetical protein n=1 Tax=Pseudonocardia sp. CA-107938 TaxID=3240021 RepID=UPI003D8EC40F
MNALLDVGQPGATAVHEASHAVVATVLGVPFDRITLHPTEADQRGAVYGLRPGKAPAAAVAAVLLAGVTGELAVWAPAPGATLIAAAAEAAAIAVCSGHIDIESFARHAPDIAADPDRISDLQDVVRGLIHGHRHAIGAVAAALVAHPQQTLISAEVSEIVHRAGRISQPRPRPLPIGRHVVA